MSKILASIYPGSMEREPRDRFITQVERELARVLHPLNTNTTTRRSPMTLTPIRNGWKYTVPDEDRGYTPPIPPEPFAPPCVTAHAVTTEGTTLEQAHAAMLHAKKTFQKHVANTQADAHLYTPEGIAEQIALFKNTAAAKAVDRAVDSVRARRDQAQAQVDKLRKDLSPAGDTAAELRATRYWNRTKAILDASKNTHGTAQELIKNADRTELGTLLEELGPYLTARNITSEWIHTVVAQAVPEYGTATKQLKKAAAAVLLTESNARTLRRAFDTGQPNAVLADPYSNTINKNQYDPDK
jgi:hypothetical protein